MVSKECWATATERTRICRSDNNSKRGGNGRDTTRDNRRRNGIVTIRAPVATVSTKGQWKY